LSEQAKKTRKGTTDMLNLKLLVVGGEVESEELTLQLPAVVGRSRESDVHLPHPLVSRRHCEIRERNGRIVVRDLGSLNGTFIGSERVEEAILQPGELLTVGTVTFRAIYEPSVGAARPADARSKLAEKPSEADGKARKAAETVRQPAQHDTELAKGQRPHAEVPRPDASRPDASQGQPGARPHCHRESCFGQAAERRLATADRFARGFLLQSASSSCGGVAQMICCTAR
jgi:pSer/pThr/pTyr-binding forkhead associated (FHA) protein